MNLLLSDERIRDQILCVKIFVMHINGRDLAIVIGAVVIDALIHVAAGGVDCDLIFAFAQVAAAALLFNGAQDMEELADGGVFRFIGDRVQLRESDFDKAGAGRKVAWQADAAHAAAVLVELNVWRKLCRRSGRGNVAVIIETEQLNVEGRIVGHDADRVGINMDAVLYGFQDDGSGLVGDHPVERRDRKLVAEGNVHETNLIEQSFGFREVFALVQDPGNEFERRDFVFAVVLYFGEEAVAREIEACHRETVFIGRIVIKREAAADKGHADHCIVFIDGWFGAKGDWKVPWGNGDSLLIREFKVEVASKVVILFLIGCAGAHSLSSFLHECVCWIMVLFICILVH